MRQLSNRDKIKSPYNFKNTFVVGLFYKFAKWAKPVSYCKPYVEQDLLTLPEHLRSPLVFGGVRLDYSLVFYVVPCVLFFCLFAFFIFRHGDVSLFSIYEFDCPSGIFHLSFYTPSKQNLYSKRNPASNKQNKARCNMYVTVFCTPSTWSWTIF